MTDENEKLLKDLEFRVNQVMYLYDTLRAENSQLISDLSEEKQKTEELTHQLEELKQKYDSLKMARTITAVTVDVETAQMKLSKLVREVDKCINLLNS